MFSRIKNWPWLRHALGYEETIWTRKMADQETRKLVCTLNPSCLSALEISGGAWQSFGFASYRQVEYPAFDICKDTLSERFDLIICEHIMEHVLSPSKAARNIHAMLNPVGHLIVITPFLYKVHPNPNDCTRWTEQGLRVLLAESGFDNIATGSWGNRKCIKATFKKEYRLFNRYLHSLENEPDYPIVIWGLARKSE